MARALQQLARANKLYMQEDFDDSSWPAAYEVCPNSPGSCDKFGWIGPYPAISGEKIIVDKHSWAKLAKKVTSVDR